MPTYAQAGTWKRAESSHFVLYSDGGTDATLTDYAARLERFDDLLRRQFGVAAASNDARKLPIFLVKRQRDLAQVDPAIGRDYAGGYYPALEGVFAIAVRRPDQEYVRHEYFHHFAFQELSATPYPDWLSEGMAEYFMTARIAESGVELGAGNPARLRLLAREEWLPIERLLSCHRGELTEDSDRSRYYALAWLLTHWLMSDPAWRDRIGSYVGDVGRGVDPATALITATGLSLQEIEAQLRQHLRDLSLIRIDNVQTDPRVEIALVPASSGRALLLSQRLKLDLSREDQSEALRSARGMALLHPNDSFVKLQQAHAEIRFGDGAVAERLLADVLAANPSNLQALQLMALRHEQLARIRGEQRAVQLAKAGGLLTRALESAPQDAYTSYLLALNAGAAGAADVSLDWWRIALKQAPQVDAIRVGYGAALSRARRDVEAVEVLEPLTFAPHSGGSDLARDIIFHAQGLQ